MDLDDIFYDELPARSGIRRVGYRPEVSNFMERQDKPLPLGKEDKGFSIDDQSNLEESQKGLELQEDLEEVSESVNRGYDQLDRATKVKVFKDLLKKYKDPILASSGLKFRVAKVLGKTVKEQGDDFDFEEFILFAKAWVEDSSLQKRSLNLKEGIEENGMFEVDKVGYYIRDLKAAGFSFPTGMDRVGETESNFARYLADKYTSILTTIKQAAENDDVDFIGLLEELGDDAFNDAEIFEIVAKHNPDSLSFRRLF